MTLQNQLFYIYQANSLNKIRLILNDWTSTDRFILNRAIFGLLTILIAEHFFRINAKFILNCKFLYTIAILFRLLQTYFYSCNLVVICKGQGRGVRGA